MGLAKWCLVLCAAVCAPVAWGLPTFDEVRRAHQPSEVLVLSREGEVLQRLRTDASVRRGQWVALPEVSAALRQAMLLSEDRRFYEHSGVDWRAASAAAWGNLWNTRTRGASTLTMQLAGLLDDDWRQGPGGRSVAQKLGQTVAAQVLDRRWRKDQILEAYLNLVPFRGEVVGIDALARTLFGKAAHGLDAQEAALAAALVRAPNARAVQVAQRACGVWREMQVAPTRTGRAPPVAAQAADCTALDMLAQAALQRRAWPASEGVAPHAARRALAQAQQGGVSPGAQLRTTLSAPLQRFAVQSLTQHLRELQGRQVEDGAVLVLDNASGEVLAWVGSSGALSGAAEVDGVLALRQPGSTLKPFLYAQALAERRLTAASLVEDSPAQIATPGGLYIPQNYDRQFKGWVSVRTALAAGALDDLALAARTYEGLHARDPGNRAVWEPLLTVYRRLGDEGRLEALIEESVSNVFDPADRKHLRMERARILLARPGGEEGAMESLRALLDEDPDDTAATTTANALAALPRLAGLIFVSLAWDAGRAGLLQAARRSGLGARALWVVDEAGGDGREDAVQQVGCAAIRAASQPGGAGLSL